MLQKHSEFEWIIKQKNLFKFIKNNIFDFVYLTKYIQLLNLSTKFGGVALRTTKHLIFNLSISAVHKITKKVWNDMDTKMTFFTNDYFKIKSMKMINHYNCMVNNKQK